MLVCLFHFSFSMHLAFPCFCSMYLSDFLIIFLPHLYRKLIYFLFLFKYHIIYGQCFALSFLLFGIITFLSFAFLVYAHNLKVIAKAILFFLLYLITFVLLSRFLCFETKFKVQAFLFSFSCLSIFTFQIIMNFHILLMFMCISQSFLQIIILALLAQKNMSSNLLVFSTFSLISISIEVLLRLPLNFLN